jgi:Protein of unknown function (DUF3040)
MLSDYERNTLREVERQLMLEDPEFAQSFDIREPKLPRGHHGLVTKIGIIIAVLLSALVLVNGSLVGALALASVTVLIWLVDGTSWPAP